MPASTLIWELQHPLLEKSSWLVGTFHVRDKRVFKWVSALGRLMDQCNGFATELDVNSAQRQAVQDDSCFFFPVGQHLRDHVSKKKYSRMRQVVLKSVGIDLDAEGRRLPFFLSSMIHEHLFNQEMPLPLDFHLWEMAASRRLKLGGVETWEEQSSVVLSQPLEDQLHDLLRLVRSISSTRKKAKKMIEYYVEGDILAIYKQGKKSLGALRKVMLYDRNYRMAARILSMISEDTWFIGIGAGHLAGKKGVLNLLKQQGIIVKPFMDAASIGDPSS